METQSSNLRPPADNVTGNPYQPPALANTSRSHRRWFNPLVIVICGVAYSISFLPYDAIGATLGPYFAFVFLNSLFLGVCAFTVAVVKRRAISIGIMLTVSLAIGLVQQPFFFGASAPAYNLLAYVLAWFGFWALLITVPLTVVRQGREQYENDL